MIIITRTPHRISLFGGSTDYESYYEQHGSLLVGFAIDKYSYISVRKTPAILDIKTRVVYSKTETVNDNSQIMHNGVRGCLEHMKIKYGVEISHLCDLPAQTGIGSSSSYIVGLLQGLYALKGNFCNSKCLADEAIYVERKLLGEKGGIQDQIWAAYGGANSIHIDIDGTFEVKPLPISNDFMQEFLDRCVLIYSGRSRKSFAIAQSHDQKKADTYKKQIHQIAKQGYDEFLNKDINNIANLLHESWSLKKKISPLISTSHINEMYENLLGHGLIGGKLLGSGGSGFIFGVLGKDVDKRDFKKKYRKRYIDFNIDTQGSVMINE